MLNIAIGYGMVIENDEKLLKEISKRENITEHQADNKWHGWTNDYEFVVHPLMDEQRWFVFDENLSIITVDEGTEVNGDKLQEIITKSKEKNSKIDDFYAKYQAFLPEPKIHTVQLYDS